MQSIGNNKGFTLIELIVVIVILGILAVTAAPRFINLTDDAVDAVTKAQFGSFKSGIQMMHAKYLVKQTTPIDVNGNGVSVAFNTEGYPQGNGSGSAACADLWNKVYADAEPINQAADYNATLAEGWNAFGFSFNGGDICGYIKSEGNETVLTSSAPHFVYFMTDFAINAGGYNYSGQAGDVKIYNL